MNRAEASILEPPLLSIIVVAYNNPELLHATLSSVRQSLVNISHEMFVVDNASQGLNWQLIQADHPDIRFLHLSHNLGFAAANNVAIGVSSGQYVLLLNPDTIVPDDAIARFVNWMEQHPRVGAAGPLLRQLDGKPQPYSFGAAPTPRYLLARLLAHRRGRYLHHWHGSEPLMVDWVAGTCLLVRRRALHDVGLLDERFFLYFEDVDWGLRFRRAGWHVMFVPTIAITHVGGGSVGQAASPHYDRSLVRWYAKYYGTWLSSLVWLALRLYRSTLSLRRYIKRRLPR